MLYQLAKFHGWSADNIAFGMGGALLQQLNRDTQKFAFKCSAAEVNGQWRPVFKDPITDPGKNSKKGRLALVEPKPGEFQTLEEVNVDAFASKDRLITVFENGELKKDYAFEEIRQRAQV